MKNVTEVIADLKIVKENNLFVHSDDRNLVSVEKHNEGEQIITLLVQFTDIMYIENKNYVVCPGNIGPGVYVSKYSILNNDDELRNTEFELMDLVFDDIKNELQKEELMLLVPNSAH